MPPDPSHEVTDLLQAWGEGDRAALEQILPLVYDELHRAARRAMRRERPDHTLQTTALIHEVFIKVAGSRAPRTVSRQHFFAIASRLMRQILVDHARARRYRKRGGGAPLVTLDELAVVAPSPEPQLVALDDALRALAAVDERKSRVVELRYFGGLGIAEIAPLLGVSPQTVKRDWRLAKAWLLREMSRSGREDADTPG